MAATTTRHLTQLLPTAPTAVTTPPRQIIWFLTAFVTVGWVLW